MAIKKYKDKTQAEYMRLWRRANRAKTKIINRRYYEKNKDILIEKSKEYKINHKEQWEEYHRKYNQSFNKKNKIDVLTHYGNGKCACVTCGYSDMRALSIDHLNNNGVSHRKQIGTGSIIYHWLIKNGYPYGYQTLCMNCQFIKKIERK